MGRRKRRPPMAEIAAQEQVQGDQVLKAVEAAEHLNKLERQYGKKYVRRFCWDCNDDRKFVADIRLEVIPHHEIQVIMGVPVLICSECGNTQPDLSRPDPLDTVAR